MHSNLSYLRKLKLWFNFKKCVKLRFSLSLLNIQSDLCAWHWRPKRPSLHENPIRSPILSRGAEVECANHHGGTSIIETTEIMWIDDLTVLSLVRKSWMSSKNSNIDCICTAQVRWKIKWLFNSNSGIFSRSWVESNNSCLRRLD